MSTENTPVENTEAQAEEFESKVTEDTASEVTEGDKQPEDDKPSKSFTQEEVDAMMGKRLAIEKRRWERKKSGESNSTEAPKLTDGVDLSQFKTNEELQRFLDNKAKEYYQQVEQKRAEQEVLETYMEREESAIEKYDDFEQVAHNPNLPITQYMAQTIRDSELGPDVAYYLGSNIQEASRISKLSPFNQAKELGKIELKLQSNPDTLGKKVSNTPPPVNPGSGKGEKLKSYDTTDPRSTKSMSTEQWIKAERERQIRKLKGG